MKEWKTIKGKERERTGRTGKERKKREDKRTESGE